MPRYLNLWEVDTTKMPTDPNERMMVIKKMNDMTKQTLKDHPGSMWGLSLDGLQGYSLSSPTATWQDMTKIMRMFSPYVKFKVLQVIDIDENGEVLKAMAQMMQMNK